jgi:hypothetical protein
MKPEHAWSISFPHGFLNDLTIISIIILVGCWAVPLGALLLPTIGVYGRVG